MQFIYNNQVGLNINNSFCFDPLKLGEDKEGF